MPPKKERPGQFSRRCAANGHVSNSSKLNEVKRLLNDWRVKKLLEKGIVSERTKYICEECLGTTEDLQGELAWKLAQLIIADANNLKTEAACKDINEIKDHSPFKWLKSRPSALVSFISALCGIDVSEETDNSQLALLAKVIETIYYCRNNRLVLPISFQQTLLGYSMTNSKQLVELMGKLQPGGSYTYICKWLDDQSDEVITPPADGTINCVFDNNQKIGRTYCITGDNKVKTSVMTSGITISYDGDLQKRRDLKPSQWMFGENKESVKESVLTYMDDDVNVYRNTRKALLSDCIGIVSKENGGGNEDYIDKILPVADGRRLCVECGLENNENARLCIGCGQRNLATVSFEDWIPLGEDESVDPYMGFSTVQTNSTAADIKVVPAEPQFVNPNSYKTVSEVVQEIGKSAGVSEYGGSNREWSFVECDGLPYILLRNLIENVWRCQTCQQASYEQDFPNSHECTPANVIREFGWVFPIPGYLHIEMNLARSFMKLNWDIYGKHIAQILGFESAKAQEYLYRGSDHHKLWQFFEIIYVAISCELVLPYVRWCNMELKTPTVDGYFNWSKENVRDPVYKYMQQSALYHLHGLMLLRVGVRRRNFSATQAAKGKIYPLFFARQHPKYREIITREALDFAKMPNELKKFRQNYFSGSRTGAPNSAQGGDALLEEINKLSKSWMVYSGVPSNKQWQRVFRNLEKLNQIKTSNAETLGLSTSNPTSRSHLVDRSLVNKVRLAFRKVGYLTNPTKERDHVSVDGMRLEKGLDNFHERAVKMMKVAFMDCLEGKQTSSEIIAVTAKERKQEKNLNGLTKTKLANEIYKIIGAMDVDQRIKEKRYFEENIKAKTKSVYLTYISSLTNEAE